MRGADCICQRSTYGGARLYLFFCSLESRAQYDVNLSKKMLSEPVINGQMNSGGHSSASPASGL